MSTSRILPNVGVCLLLVLAGCNGLGGGGSPSSPGTTTTFAETTTATHSETVASPSRDGPNSPGSNRSRSGSADSDSDGLSDARERELGTDPETADTDGDGIEDGTEVTATDRFPDADPLHKDVYVEIDYMNGERPPEADLAAIESSFARAPIANPDGESGVDVHLRVDEAVPSSPTTWGTSRSGRSNDIWDYRDRYAQLIDRGHYYAVVVNEVRTPNAPASEVNGYSFGNVLMVENFGEPAVPDNVLVHELGHVLGLAPFQHRGIDSQELSFEAYPSVMNYNAPDTYVEFSNGTNSPADHDDWAVIDRCLGWHVGTDDAQGDQLSTESRLANAIDCL